MLLIVFNLFVIINPETKRFIIYNYRFFACYASNTIKYFYRKITNKTTIHHNVKPVLIFRMPESLAFFINEYSFKVKRDADRYSYGILNPHAGIRFPR